jgi:hypothetical protein
MFDGVVTVFYVIAAIGWLVAIALLIRRIRSARVALRRPPNPHAWPMEFPLIWANHFGSRSLNRFLFWLVVVNLGLLLVVEGIDWALHPSWETGRLPLLMALWALVAWLETQIPHVCTIGDEGISLFGNRAYFAYFHGPIPWECIRRYTVEPRRLLLVIERPGNRAWMQHVEIPLADLPDSYRPVLEKVLLERTASRREPATVAG